MFMMLLQNSPGLMEQLGVGGVMIEKEIERREKLKRFEVL